MVPCRARSPSIPGDPEAKRIVLFVVQAAGSESVECQDFEGMPLKDVVIDHADDRGAHRAGADTRITNVRAVV